MDSPPPAHIFLYGTLRPEIATGAMANLVRTLERVGPATVLGRLYDLGSYPGLVLGGRASRVHGVLLRLPESESLLAALDAYEGFDPTRPDSSLFLRRTVTVELEAGGAIPAWAYTYARSVAGARLIASGDYLRHRQAHAVDSLEEEI